MTTTNTTLPDWWIETTLGESIEILDWDRWENYPNWNDFSSSWYCLFLNTKNVPNTQFSFNETMFITKEKDQILRKWKLQRWDFVLTTRGTVWNYAFYSDKIKYDNIRINSWMVILRTNQDKWFFNFYLKSQLFKHQILSLQSWTAQPQLPIKDLKTFSVIFPPLPEQQAIAKVLSSFDDKIELLREQNETLEKLAQTIFEEWFGKYSIDDELPKGWRVGKLGEELETFLWWTPSKLNENFWTNWTIPWINSGEVNNFRIIEATEMITEEALRKSATKLLQKWTVVIAITWATLWQYSRLEIDCCFNQSVVWIKENEKIQSSYIYFWISSNIWNIIKNATWWAHQHINKENVNQTDFLIPRSDILNWFYKLVNPIMDKISNNMFEIKELSKTRDELLLKLMKGEVRIV